MEWNPKWENGDTEFSLVYTFLDLFFAIQCFSAYVKARTGFIRGSEDRRFSVSTWHSKHLSSSFGSTRQEYIKKKYEDECAFHSVE